MNKELNAKFIELIELADKQGLKDVVTCLGIVLSSEKSGHLHALALNSVLFAKHVILPSIKQHLIDHQARYN